MTFCLDSAAWIAQPSRSRQPRMADGFYFEIAFVLLLILLNGVFAAAEAHAAAEPITR